MAVSFDLIDAFVDEVFDPAAHVAVDRDIDADPVAWIQQNFHIPETGGPMRLYPSQAEPLREALSRGPDGKFNYSTVLWGAIKKSAKSSIAAAVGMWFAMRKPLSSIKVLGNDLDQAQSRVYEYMRRSVLLRPDWKDSIQVNNYKMTFPNGSVIKAIPVDPTGEAGGNDDLVLYTELWGWKSRKHQQMWTESTLSPTKYGESLRWCETYAGYVGESPVLEQLYEQGVKKGRVVDAEHEMYANDASRVFALWTTRPSLPWQTPAYYAQEGASLAPTEYGRVHENRWGTAVNPFLEDMAWWDACKSDIPAPRPMQPVVVALDAAVTNDCFGIIAVKRDDGIVSKVAARAWIPPQGGKIAFSNVHNPDDIDTPEGYCRWLAKTFNVVEWAFDPYQLEDFAQRLGNQGLGFFNPFPQGSPRAVADKQLYDSIMQKQLVHDGDPTLREHIQNANRKPEGDKMRIIKRAEHMKIDLCVALSMANNRARFLNIG